MACSLIVPRSAQRGQRPGGARLDDLADAHDAAPIVAVGDVTDDQHQRHRGQELREPDKPEVERAAGQRVDLPADRDRLHLVREHRRSAARSRSGRTIDARGAHAEVAVGKAEVDAGGRSAVRDPAQYNCDRPASRAGLVRREFALPQVVCWRCSRPSSSSCTSSSRPRCMCICAAACGTRSCASSRITRRSWRRTTR